jgi:polar amino acid transport system substrate-binding protein
MRNATLVRTLWLMLVITLGSSISIEPVLALPTQQTDSTSSISVLQRIRNRGNVLVAGVKYDFPPFGFEDDEGNLTGFDIELINAIAEVWGVKVEFVRLTSADRIPLLATGEVDIVVASLTQTRAREAAIDFSQTYFLDGQGLLVRQAAGFNELNDLQGKRIAAIQGTTSIQQIKAYAQNNAVEIEIVSFQDYLSALEALKAGYVEALTTDISALNSFAKDNANLVVLGEQFTYEPYAMGMPAGDYLFRNLLNSTLQQLKVNECDNEINRESKINKCYDNIYREWFPNATPYPIAVLPDLSPYTFNEAPIKELEVPKQSLVEKITSKPQLVAGVKDNFPPYSYRDEKGACCIGFSIKLIKELVKRWRNDEDAVTFVPIADSIQRVSADEVDIVAAPVIRTWATEENLYFSQTYFVDAKGNFAEEPYVLGIPNNDHEFSEKVNSALQEIQQDGTYAGLYQRWFTGLSDIAAIEMGSKQPALVFLPASTAISVTTMLSPTSTLTNTATTMPTVAPTITATLISLLSGTPEPTVTMPLSVGETQSLTNAQIAPSSLPATGASFGALRVQQVVFILLIGIVAILISVRVTTRSKTTSQRKDNEKVMGQIAKRQQ